MQIGELTAKLKIVTELVGDPVVLRYLDAQRERRFRYVALIGTWLVALAIAWLALGCAVPKVPSHLTGEARTTAEMRQSASVEVSVLCLQLAPDGQNIGGTMANGSGVIVDNTHVLTAYHVVDCKGSANIIIMRSDGTRSIMRIDKIEPGTDTARLVLSHGSFSVNTVRYGKPRVGDGICAHSMRPTPAIERCGKITTLRNRKDIGDSGDIKHTMPTIPGNSGSGAYNQRGELIGIVVQWTPTYDPVAGFKPNGGYVASISNELKP